VAYWLTIEREYGVTAPLPATMANDGESQVYGTTVPQLLGTLDRIAQELGLKSIDNFIYKDTKGYRFLLQEAEAEGNAVLASAMRAEIAILAQRSRWHEPAAARETIHSLKEFLAANPHILTEKYARDANEWTLWDLEAYERILTELEEGGSKFAFVERNDQN
jgi:hypothetical protein